MRLLGKQIGTRRLSDHLLLKKEDQQLAPVLTAVLTDILNPKIPQCLCQLTALLRQHMPTPSGLLMLRVISLGKGHQTEYLSEVQLNGACKGVHRPHSEATEVVLLALKNVRDFSKLSAP